MSILLVPATMDYPPGYTGNPYTPNDVSVFFDMNWPDHAGMLSEGYSSPGLLSGLGQTCISYDDDGDCLSYSSPTDTLNSDLPITSPTLSTALPNLNTFSNSSACNSFAITASQAAACGIPSVPLDPNSTNLQSALLSSTSPQSVTLTAAQTQALQAGMTPAQQAQLISAIGNSTVSLIRTASGGPYTVAGTNLVYNPATGQLTTAAATNATATLTAGLGALSQYIPIILLAVAAIVVVPAIMGKK
jgi:hypothetical protein